MFVRIRKTKLLEEDVRHSCIEVLSGMNQYLFTQRGTFPQGAQNWRGFHEIGTRSDNMQSFHDSSVDVRCD